MSKPWIIFVMLMATAWTVSGQSLNYDHAGRVTQARYDTGATITYHYMLDGSLTNIAFTGTQTETDSDGDGMPDAWEWVYFNKLTNAAAGDFNGDTISNLKHYQDQTDPTDPDSDGDGMPNWAEILAGTSPTNALSVLQVEEVAPPGGVGTVIRWQSVAGKKYRLQRSTNLPSGSFPSLSTNITATPTLNIYTDQTATGTGPYHYRVELE